MLVKKTPTERGLKIGLKFVKSSSGANIWVNNLIHAINKRNVDTTLKYFDLLRYFLPFNMDKEKEKYDIFQTDILGFRFNSERPLVVVEHYLRSDPVLSKYSSISQKIYSRVTHCFELKTLKKAQKIVSVSKYTQKRLKELLSFDSELIYNGIDTKKFRPMKVKRKNRKIRLLFVGNLIKRKGIDLLPKIMAKLGKDFELYYTAGLRTKNILKQKNMFPLGKLSEPELIREYNKCDILLFPTRLEGFGYAVAEAMACGKPVVTTNCSSLPELLIDRKGGFLCKMDDVNDFVKKIRILAKDKNLRKKMGKFNRKRILENFTLEAMGKKYVNLYKKLANK